MAEDGKCKYCGDGVGYEHWDVGLDFCPRCIEIEEERYRKRREWGEYHDEPCPEVELPPYRENGGVQS